MRKVASWGLFGAAAGVAVGLFFESAAILTGVAQFTIVVHMAVVFGFVGLWLATVILQSADGNAAH
jgi:hypothetical protein